MEDRINLLDPHLSGNENYKIQDAFNKNEISSIGNNVCEFKNKLVNYLKEPVHITLLNSGTSAIHLALMVLGVDRGDEVICQSFTFCASANPILYLGAKPIFIDSEIDTWNMSPFFLEEGIKNRIEKGKKPKAIIVVNSYGMPAKWDELKNISIRYDIPIIEDAAEALGSEYKGRKCGTFGDISIISFNTNKIITSAGGGALVCNNKMIAEKVTYLATQAKEVANFYLHKEVGYNYVMNNVNASIGSAQMDMLDIRVQQKREIHTFYKKLFDKIEGYDLLNSIGSAYFSNHWLNCILIDINIVKKSNLELKEIFNKRKIETRLLWYPLHLQPIHENYPFYGDNTCLKMFKSGLCLPSSTFLTELEIKRVSSILTTLL
ncbi:MAG: aminotransferase class I/II-fold pyridoxal phosphate-dependent enzyme [Flavobacteriaceae bacterium]